MKHFLWNTPPRLCRHNRFERFNTILTLVFRCILQGPHKTRDTSFKLIHCGQLCESAETESCILTRTFCSDCTKHDREKENPGTECKMSFAFYLPLAQWQKPFAETGWLAEPTKRADVRVWDCQGLGPVDLLPLSV